MSKKASSRKIPRKVLEKFRQKMIHNLPKLDKQIAARGGKSLHIKVEHD